MTERDFLKIIFVKVFFRELIDTSFHWEVHFARRIPKTFITNIM